MAQGKEVDHEAIAAVAAVAVAVAAVHGQASEDTAVQAATKLDQDPAHDFAIAHLRTISDQTTSPEHHRPDALPNRLSMSHRRLPAITSHTRLHPLLVQLTPTQASIPFSHLL